MDKNFIKQEHSAVSPRRAGVFDIQPGGCAESAVHKSGSLLVRVLVALAIG